MSTRPPLARRSTNGLLINSRAPTYEESAHGLLQSSEPSASALPPGTATHQITWPTPPRTSRLCPWPSVVERVTMDLRGVLHHGPSRNDYRQTATMTLSSRDAAVPSKAKLGALFRLGVVAGDGPVVGEVRAPLGRPSLRCPDFVTPGT